MSVASIIMEAISAVLETKDVAAAKAVFRLGKGYEHLQAQLKTLSDYVTAMEGSQPFEAPSQQAIDDFYNSWDWRKLRYDFLKDKQRRCYCCGNTPNHGVRIVVDHIKPLRRYWQLRLDPNNLQLMCDDCNKGKSNRDTTDWR